MPNIDLKYIFKLTKFRKMLVWQVFMLLKVCNGILLEQLFQRNGSLNFTQFAGSFKCSISTFTVLFLFLSRSILGTKILPAENPDVMSFLL
jgi:hypothetical protein